MSPTAEPPPTRPPLLERVTRLGSASARPRSRDVARVLVLAVAGLVFVGAASGYLTVKVFHQYSTLKWGILLGVPLLAVLLLVRRPALWAAGLVIVTLPIEPYVATIKGQPVSVLLVTATLATFVITLEGGLRRSRSGPVPAVVRLMPWILVLLVVPVALGTNWQHQVLWAAVFIDVVWICLRITTLYPDGRLMLVLIFVGSAALQALIAMAQYATHSSFNLYGGAGTSTYSNQTYFFDYGTTTRTTGTFFDPISLGNVLAMAIPLALLIVLRRDLRPAYRWFAGLAGLVLLGGLTVSLSRASWLGALAGIACVALFSRGEQRRRASVVSVVVLALVAVVALSVYGSTITERFSSILDPTASSVRTSAGDKARQQEWKVGLDTFEADPLTGVGFGNLTARIELKVPGTDNSAQAQNTYLQFLAEGGVFGGGVLVLLGAGVATDLYRSRRQDWLYPALVGTFVSVAVTWVTDYTIRYMAVEGCLALMVGLAATGGSGRAGATGQPPDGQAADGRTAVGTPPDGADHHAAAPPGRPDRVGV